jgi:DNA-binding response OmpR family regulator
MISRILVVDDDQAVCRAMARTLARSGCEVRTAHDAAPALEMTTDWTPDAVLVDLNMPTSGLALVAELRARFGRELFVAMLTGEDHDATLQECRVGGADEVLVKPILPGELRRRLRVGAS